MANPCLSCRLADWKRTASGRLHPSGDGRCRWKMPEITLPKAFYYSSSGVPRPYGGHISRKDEKDCAVAEPVSGEAHE